MIYAMKLNVTNRPGKYMYQYDSVLLIVDN